MSDIYRYDGDSSVLFFVNAVANIAAAYIMVDLAETVYEDYAR